jgi:hypothetical protein
MEIDWNSGEGMPRNAEIDAAIAELARVSNRSNDNDWFFEAEGMIRSALSLALYNPKLLKDVLALLTAARGEKG